MKVLSWDVGIINLAFCMIEYNDEKWKILDWGIINLTNREKLNVLIVVKMHPFIQTSIIMKFFIVKNIFQKI